MKLTIFFLVIGLLHVQAKGISQTVTFSGKNVTLQQVFDVVKEQTGYSIFSNRELLKNTRSISLNVSDMPLPDFLNLTFNDQPIGYVIRNKTIVLRRKESGQNTAALLDRSLDMLVLGTITGVIRGTDGQPLQGINVAIKGTSNGTVSNEEGRFSINANAGDVLVISGVGFQTREIKIGKETVLNISLQVKINEMDTAAVTYISTGYQNIPKERATGSFEVIDNKLFNRSAGTDVFSRLDAITTGTLFSGKSQPATRRRPYSGLSIRGPSSFRIYSPLIVLDNLPYEGDPNNINPNDVESVTLLKDAAAASIWGSRAANGVIVITTKKGKLNEPFHVALNSNITITGKPDLFYLKKMSSSDFIDVEKMLFSKGYYDGELDPSYPFTIVSPVVELLNTQRELPIEDVQGRAEIDRQIDELRKYDVRDDILKYTYRKEVKQQYALTLSGGDKKISYLLSAGYDKNLDNFIITNYNRTTLRLNTTINPIKRLSIETGFFYSKNNEAWPNGASSIQVYGNYGSAGGRDLWPYSRLADDQGNPLAIENRGFRSGYTDTAGHGFLLDWKYRPLAEKNDASSIVSSQEMLLNIGVKYMINSLLNAELRYQYQKTDGQQRDWFGIGSYWVRNNINLFTQFDDNGIIAQPMPMGETLTLYHKDSKAQTWRGQLNFDKNWNRKHQLTAIAGAEIRENFFQSDMSRLYGYDPNTLAYQQVDYVSTFPLINGTYGGGMIEGVDPSQFLDLSNRYVSAFANASYDYDRKYIFSLSARKDATNFFGVASNKKWSPLWSSGFKWNISNEAFYTSTLVPNLSLRVTYGKNGNAENGIPAVATITYIAGRGPTNYPFAVNDNPPNSELGMEKVGVLNVGLDFSFKKNRIAGSIEYFEKNSKGVLASAPVDPTTGFRSALYNSAEIKGKGVEVQLNTRNLSLGSFEWGSNLLFTYNKPIVTHYGLENTNVNSYVQNSGSPNALVGKDYYAVFAYPFAGLDHDTGDPKGYVKGEESTDYVAIMSSAQPLSVLKYFGSAQPLYYGAIRNNFTWNKLSLSVNISYRFSYFVHRSGIQYYNLFSSSGDNGHAEFADRWQKPGDELHTNVPSMNYDHPNNYSRDQFYRYSSAWVVKGDNIRLEDINLNYTFNRLSPYLKNIRIYANANNLGILWRANKAGIDPDFGSGLNMPPSRTVVFGLTAEF